MPCFFSDNQQLLQFANYDSDSYGLLSAMNNLLYYINIMNPSNK
jgi:hypothetical protein